MSQLCQIQAMGKKASQSAHSAFVLRRTSQLSAYHPSLSRPTLQRSRLVKKALHRHFVRMKSMGLSIKLLDAGLAFYVERYRFTIWTKSNSHHSKFIPEII